MFSIQAHPFGYYTEYKLWNTDTEEFVSIIPAFGGTLNQVALRKGNKVHELLNGSKTYEELITEGKSKFKGSKLFPFPNRIADGSYVFENKKYEFPINFPHEKNSIHGIVLERDFVVVKKQSTANEASITLEYRTTESEEGYPFRTIVSIEYRLTQDGFSCNTIVENIDQQSIPIGDGWHPYFKTGSKMDDCVLELPVEYSYEVDHRMIPTGKKVAETVFTKPTQIAAYNFDTGYKLQASKSQQLSTTLFDPLQNITIRIWQDAGEGGYDYLQVYIPPDRQSIAIEPMSCLADGFNNEEGLISLKSGEKRIFSFGLKLE